ncbi:MAG: ponA [Blastococcus sp.]|jgi:membrane peptidoglycan carboxypeptidase|nr:ponA [Blastococcus sp.]
MSENVRIRTRLIVKLAMTVVIAGALFAGVLLPWVGGTGLVARNSASLLHALPGELTDQAPAGNTTVLAADGSLITKFYKNNRTPVPSNKIAPIMKQALVDIEDSRFYEHNGVDVQGTFRALVANVASGSVREGGSTITQQLVKQTLLQTATSAAERSAAIEQNGVQGVSRKLKEARLALALEEKYSKDEILTRYLNIVYFGEGAYGIEAAAQRYFSVSAAALKLPQAAMLAGLVQSPSGDDPLAHPESAAARRNKVLDRMRSLGHITAKEVAAIAPKPVAVKPGGSPPNGCIDAALGGFFCSYVHDYLIGKLGVTQQQLDTGGLTIKTTLQPALQRSADQGVLNHAPMGDKFAGIVDAVQPGTGNVLAMAANRRYGCTDPDCESVNLNVVPSHGSGSTYKVFTAAAALTEGFGAHYSINAPQPYTSKVYKGYKNGHFGPLVVWNDDPRYKSTYDMTSGLVASSNTYYVGLEDALGSVEKPVRISEAMGMHYDAATQDSADKIIQNQFGAFTLGYNATSPLDLASAYSTIAASGTQCDPRPVTAVLDQNGQPLTDAKGKVIDTGVHCKQNAISPKVANTLANMMVGVVSPAGTGRKAIIPGHAIGGKTGTTQDNQTAAFVGITPQYAVSVMYFAPLGHLNVGGVGGGVPASMFHDTMAPVLGAQPNHPFPPADPATVEGTRGRGYVAAPPPAPPTTTATPGTPTTPTPPGPNGTPPVATPPAAPTTAGGRPGRPPRHGGGRGR